MKSTPLRIDVRSKGFAIASMLVVQCIFLVAQILLIKSPAYGDEHTTDLVLYQQYALKFLDGEIPYRDFQMEYPPLALVVFGLPGLFSMQKPIDYEAYQALFVIEMALFSLATNFILFRILSIGKLELANPITTIGMYTLGVFILSPLMPWRFDMFPAFLTILAFLFIQSKKPFLGGAMLGLGIVAKLYPLVIMPIFCSYYWAGKNPKAFWRMAMGLVLAASILIPLFAFDPDWMLQMLSYHKLRGLNIDSLPGGIFLLAKATGLMEVQITHDFGSFNIEAPYSNQVVQWLTPLSVIVLGIVIMLSFFRFRQERGKNGSISGHSLVAYSVIVLLAFILTSKVFSPQYLIWLLPFIPFLKLRQARFFLIVAALTMLLYPFIYALLIAAEPASVLLLNLRNLLALVLFVWLLATNLPARGIPRKC